MMQTLQTIGVLGGTFDPIHVGHLRLAIECQTQLKLDAIHLIPSHQPVHRPRAIATAEERLAMLKAAVKDTNLVVDPREIQQQKPMYTIDTLMQLREEMPERSLSLLIGMDGLLSFDTWHRYTEILHYAHIVVAYRPPYALPAEGSLAGWFKQHLEPNHACIHQQKAGGLFLLPIPLLEISASEIRKQFAIGGNPRYLLPEAVYQYIQSHGIYTS